MRVTDVLAKKPVRIITIKPSDTVATLSALLREKRIGAAVVSSDGWTVEGVISERDIAYGLAIHTSAMAALPVSALMTRAVITCTPTDTVGHVASTMMARNIRHIPVVEAGRLVGIRDVLNLRVDELQQQTAGLRSFVSQTDLAPQDR